MKWINMIALGILLIGGISFLLMGLFKFDLFASIFGGTDAFVTRLFYTIFGLAALTILATILWNAFMGKSAQKSSAPKTPAKTA